MACDLSIIVKNKRVRKITKAVMFTSKVVVSKNGVR